MDNYENLVRLLFLKNIKGLGKATIHRKYADYLRTYFEGIVPLRDLIIENESSISSEDIESAWVATEKVVDELVDSPDISTITMFDDEYPERLSVMGDKRPLIIYAKGNIEALNMASIAIIGTRYPQISSMESEERIVNCLMRNSDRAIISGLALGCDEIAHKTAVECQRETIAVLPSGVNNIVPASNRKLADKILDMGGCIVSEYEPSAEPSRYTFVERDSVVAALSDIVFAMECKEESGTMHTVDFACKYGKTVGCYYREDIDRNVFSGNIKMIEHRNAIPVSDKKDLMALLDAAGNLNRDEKEEKHQPHQITFDEWTRSLK